MRRRCLFASLLPPGILLLSMATGISAGLAGDLPPEVVFARFKEKVRQDVGRLANCTCLETIERSVRQPGADSYQFLDRVRLEVTTAGEKELLTWPGGARFEEWAVTSFVTSGLVATGMFSSYARNLFLRDGATFQYGGLEELDGRRLVRYDFRVSLLSNSHRLRNGDASAAVASKGSFWFDAGSLELVRLDEFADEIPAELGLTGALTRIRYERLPNAVPDLLLPQSAEIVLRHSTGEIRRNKIEFAQCREYLAESSVSFGPREAAGETPQTAPSRVDLPGGLTIKMELDSSFDSATAAIGDTVRAHVVEDVRQSGKRILPKGAAATGRIRSMERQTRAGGFLLGMELTGMRWENNQAELKGELLEARGAKQSQATVRAVSQISGGGAVFVKGEQWSLPAGLRMVWLTSRP